MADDKAVKYNEDDSNPQTKRFIQAVYERDEAKALAAIRNGADIHYEMSVGDGGALNTVSVAALLGWPDVANELLTRDPKLIDYKVDTERNMNILHAVVNDAYKTSLNGRDPDKYVFDMETNKRGEGRYEQVWNLLVWAKPSLLTERDLYGKTPLANAITEHDEDFVSYMVAADHSKRMNSALALTPVPEKTDSHLMTPSQGIKAYEDYAKQELARINKPDASAEGLYIPGGGYDPNKALRAERKSEKDIVELLGTYEEVLLLQGEQPQHGLTTASPSGPKTPLK